MPRPPMVAIVGRKHHGKTTLAVRLAAELGRRGYRVMSIKHGSHTFNIDPETTDTYRHYHEGQVERVAMVSPDKFALIQRWSAERTPEEIADQFMSDADVIICEGFTRSTLPKIEVFRTAAVPSAPTAAARVAPLYDPDTAEAAHYLAIVTDDGEFPEGPPVIRFADPAWLDAVADVVERRVMGRGGERE